LESLEAEMLKGALPEVTKQPLPTVVEKQKPTEEIEEGTCSFPFLTFYRRG
jgi:hypothetical protein